jgi:antirestriction protein ArdC
VGSTQDIWRFRTPLPEETSATEGSRFRKPPRSIARKEDTRERPSPLPFLFAPYLLRRHMQTTKHHAIYDQVTSLVLEALESGVERWQQPWVTRTPVNAVTRRPYRGINTVVLALTAAKRGFSSSGWVTYRASIAAGGHVKRGERGTTIVWWERRTETQSDERATRPDAAQEIVSRSWWLTRTFTLFNLDQCQGLDALRGESRQRADFEDPSAEWKRVVTASGARLLHDSSAAYFSPVTDTIHMPAIGQFTSTDAYSATLAHELIHSTGTPNRLNRQLLGRFGDHEYAIEELVAELGAAFLCGRFGINHISRAASYIDSWMRVLRTDNRAIFTAARFATQAADYLSSASDEPDQEDLAPMLTAPSTRPD